MADDYIFGSERARQAAMIEIGRAMNAQCDADEAERAAAARDPLQTLPFLPTSVATRIFNVIERCVCMRRNGLVIGSPGIGKTMALREAWRRSQWGEGPEVAIVKVQPVYGTSLMALFEELAPVLNVRPANSVAATVRRIVKEASFKPLVLFDEAQNLTYRIVHQLLSISEDAGVQMVFVGNPNAVQLVNSQTADIRLVSRRLPYRDEIEGITDTDADLVAQHFAVEGMAGFNLCREIGAAFHMDGVVELLREARRLAGDEKTLRPQALQGALEAFPQFVAGLAKAEGPRALRQRSTPRRITG